MLSFGQVIDLPGTASGKGDTIFTRQLFDSQPVNAASFIS